MTEVKKNTPEVLMEGVETPVGEVTFARLNPARPLQGTTTISGEAKEITPQNKIVLVVDSELPEFNTFTDRVESVGINKSISDVVKDDKRIKGKKKITAKTFAVGEHSTLTLINSDGSPFTETDVDTRFDTMKAKAVVKVLHYPANATRSLELEAVIVEEFTKGERPAPSMTDAAQAVLAKYQAKKG